MGDEASEPAGGASGHGRVPAMSLPGGRPPPPVLLARPAGQHHSPAAAYTLQSAYMTSNSAPSAVMAVIQTPAPCSRQRRLVGRAHPAAPPPVPMPPPRVCIPQPGMPQISVPDDVSQSLSGYHAGRVAAALGMRSKPDPWPFLSSRVAAAGRRGNPAACYPSSIWQPGCAHHAGYVCSTRSSHPGCALPHILTPGQLGQGACRRAAHRQAPLQCPQRPTTPLPRVCYAPRMSRYQRERGKDWPH